MRLKHTMILITGILLVWSCGPIYPEGGGDTGYPVPEISAGSMTFNEDLQMLHVECTVNYDSIPQAVLLELYLNDADTPFLEDTCLDSGTDGDLLSGDMIYGLTAAYVPAGEDTVIAEFICVTESLTDITYRDSLIISPNEAPCISLVDVPDTVTRPDTGSVVITFKVHAADPDGVQDVTDAYFQVLSNATGAWGADLTLYDDGSNGDDLQGDGIFSRALSISSDNSAVTNYLRFRLKDSAANFSQWVSDSMVVR